MEKPVIGKKSVLGSRKALNNYHILFALFLNDIQAKIYACYIEYLDDAKMFGRPSNGFMLLSDLSRLYQWGLTFNPSK